MEKEAKNLLAEYFYLNAEELAVKSVKDTPGLKLEGSKLIIRCQDVLTFPEINIECDILKLFDISHIFIEHNESFSIFLQRNASNVTQLEFFSGSLKFDSVNKILQKLSSLKKIQFCNDVEYETSKEVLTTACEKLLKLEVYSADSSNLLQAFQKFQTIQKLSVKNPKVALQEILQKYANIVELEVVVHDNYPVSHQYETNSNQLKVLKIKLCTKNEKIQEELFTFVQSQHNLQQFFFHCINNSLSQSICKRLATYICQLEHLSSLLIYDRKLLEEVEAFVANYPTENTRLKELKCGLIYLKLPSSFFGYFTNLTTLDIHCSKAKLIKVEDLFSFMKNTQLTSITLRELSLASFQLFKSLHVETLEVLDIKIHNEPQDKVFDVLLEFLPRHPRITQFRINLLSNYDDLKSPELISMIVGTLKILEKLEIVNCPKITVEILKQITTLKSLKSWQINDYKSETFYET